MSHGMCTFCGHGGHRASTCPRRRGLQLVITFGLGLSLSGCAELGKVAPQLAVVDTFCLNAQKKTWSMSDTPETIREARIHNGVIDRRCGGGKAKS